MADFGPGLYDQLIDELLSNRLDALAQQRLATDIQDVDPAELPDRIGEVLGRWAHDALSAVDSDQRAEAAIDLSRAVLGAIAGLQPDAGAPDRALVAPVQRLAAIEWLAPTDEPIPIRRPLIPLHDTVLMTNARNQPAVGREIEAEIDSADRIDLVLAFIRWTGIRELLPLWGPETRSCGLTRANGLFGFQWGFGVMVARSVQSGRPAYRSDRIR